MKSILGVAFLLLISCLLKQEKKVVADNLSLEPNSIPETKQDSLFELDIIHEENFVKITPPKGLDFNLPDSTSKTEPYRVIDFNADNKIDIMVYLGACGTGGCVYGVFLNRHKNYYKLAFIDYVKNIELKKEKNGFFSITSTEEVEPYNPSKLNITKFKFDQKKHQYQLDTTYIRIDQ